MIFFQPLFFTLKIWYNFEYKKKRQLNGNLIDGVLSFVHLI